MIEDVPLKTGTPVQGRRSGRSSKAVTSRAFFSHTHARARVHLGVSHRRVLTVRIPTPRHRVSYTRAHPNTHFLFRPLPPSRIDSPGSGYLYLGTGGPQQIPVFVYRPHDEITYNICIDVRTHTRPPTRPAGWSALRARTVSIAAV
jgi:hypothetical protein